MNDRHPDAKPSGYRIRLTDLFACLAHHIPAPHALFNEAEREAPNGKSQGSFYRRLRAQPSEGILTPTCSRRTPDSFAGDYPHFGRGRSRQRLTTGKRRSPYTRINSKTQGYRSGAPAA